MSQFIRKQHKLSILLYHIVCPAKYRKMVFMSEVTEKLKEICEEIALRYEIDFVEIGADGNHVHFLVQSVPKYSPNDKINYSQRNIQTTAESKEAVMGRRVLVGPLFHQHSRRTRNGRNDKTVCQKSR